MATKVTSRVLATDAVVRAGIGDDAIGTAEIADDAITSALVIDDLALGGNPTTTTQSTTNSSTRIATTAFVQAAIDTDINALIDSAPGTMNTLDEIAAALNDDPSFTTTVNNAIALKAPIANPTFTGNATFDSPTLYVDGSNNRVGVGTTTVDHKLHVEEATANTACYVKVESASWDAGIQLNNANGAWEITNDYTGLGTTGALNFYGNSASRMTITSAGKVGIGDTSPQDYLEINGSGSGLGGLTISNSTHNHAALSFARSSTATARIYIHEPGATHTSALAFQTSDASGSSPNLITAMTISEAQNVGIGTTAPTAKFEIHDDSGGFSTSSVAASVASSVMHIQGNNDMRIIFTEDGSSYRGMLGYEHAGSTYMGIWDSGSSATPSLVSQGGKIGIGTTSPTYPLDVVANSSAQAIKVRGRSDHIGEINFTNNAGDSTYSQIQSLSSELKIKAIANIPLSLYTNNTARLTISNSGNISTYPPAGNHFVINENGVDSDFRVESDGNAHMISVDGGNNRVGIGGAPSSHTLEVSGTISGSAGIYAATMFQITGGRYWSFRESGNDMQIYSGSNAATPIIIDGDNNDNVFIGNGGGSSQFNVAKSAYIEQVALSSGTSVTWDADAAGNAYLLLGHNATIGKASNGNEGQIIMIEIAQGGTAYTVAWHTDYEFAASTAPTMTATANKTDIYTFRYNGGVWQEIGRSQNMAQS